MRKVLVETSKSTVSRYLPFEVLAMILHRPFVFGVTTPSPLTVAILGLDVVQCAVRSVASIGSTVAVKVNVLPSTVFPILG